MLSIVLPVLFLFAQEIQTIPAQQGAQPAAPAVDYTQGELRAEITAMREMRFSIDDPAMAGRFRSELALQVRVAGTPLPRIVRHGNLLLTEVVDDTGHALVTDETYSEADRTTTRPQAIPLARLQSEGLLLATRCEVSQRGAKELRRLRGEVQLFLADEAETVTIVNPFQYVGRIVEHPRLAELGIEIEVVAPERLQSTPPANRTIVLQYKSRPEQVKSALFYDGWMRQLPARDTVVQTRDEQNATMFYFDVGQINNEIQLVFEVHPKVEEIRLPIDLTSVALP
ncbi:MAG: hypothetical protein IPM18_11315 [Phycisphaerales bacterium]|nr:hypothetical protein [Phycisphaerales bacterium]